MEWSRLGPAMLAATVMVGGTTPDAAAPVTRPKVETLLQAALDAEFAPGREVLIDLVEIPPNGALERHWHPGEEFHYYLEGDARVEIDGMPAVEGKAGTVGHVPFRKTHRAIAGPRGAKVLVFRVHTQGQPSRYPAEHGRQQ
jgi:quercetin dioxygenase-like cupin family protein